MFTGLVECIGTVVALKKVGSGCDLLIRPDQELPVPAIGDSIATNGCCLTVTQINEQGQVWTFQAGEETLSRTNLGNLSEGSRVNLETSMCLGDKIGGHLVTGHVDGLGTLAKIEPDGEWAKYWFTIPSALSPQLASKGSIAVDGISLTLVDVTDDQFSVALIPHTLEVTTLGNRQVGDSVNLETDVLAKYVQRQLQFLPKQ